MPGLPLADLRIIAIEQFGAGPWATLQLADLGAEVIKIEDPAAGGDVGRVRPALPGRGGLSLLRDPQSQQAERLPRPSASAGTERARSARCQQRCSVLQPAGRPAGEARASLRRPEARQPEARLLLAVGFRHDRAVVRPSGGYDYMMQGLAGWQSLTGDPDGPADEERPFARGSLRRVRRRHRDAGGRQRRPTRRGRL